MIVINQQKKPNFGANPPDISLNNNLKRWFSRNIGLWQSNRTYFLDEPQKTYNFKPKLFDAIKRAGGITRNTDLRNIELVRENTISNGGGKIKTDLDLLAVLTNGDSSQWF